MSKRVISILTLAGYIATLAAVPHGAGNDTQHASRAHFHLTWLEHSGHADACEHVHSHAHHLPDGDSTLPVARSVHQDHDSDAIYLPSGIGAFVTPTNLNAACDTVQASAPFAPIHAALCIKPPPSIGSSPPSHDSAPNCALYLILRALRI